MEDVRKEALEYVKKHAVDLIDYFADKDEYPPTDNPECIFMAGSPGAGKTEISRKFIEAIMGVNPGISFLRIDADDVRERIPGYKGKNASVYQQAAVRGAQKILDHVLNSKQSFIFDGTFADLKMAKENINRCLKRGIKITIIYVYLDPVEAWGFTKKREKLEGRVVPEDVFVNAFFEASRNVNTIKEEYGSKVSLNVVVRNLKTNTFKLNLNVDKVENYVKNEYNPQTLRNSINN